MKRSGEGQADVARKPRVFLLEGQKDPFVLQKVERGPDVPEGRQDIVNVLPDTPQFPVETLRAVHVFEGVGAEHTLELLVLEGKMVNVVKEQEIGQALAVLDDIGIDPSAVRPAAADVEIPRLSGEDPGFQEIIAQPVEQKDRYGREKRAETKCKHGGGHG